MRATRCLRRPRGGRRGESSATLEPIRNPGRLNHGRHPDQTRAEPPMSNSLMTTRRFAPLFWCQFFSAFNDNFLKNALVILILFKIGGDNAEALITLAAAALILPFFFLSGLGGQLADRYDKSLVAQRLKLVEIGVAAL